jgi:GDPmannose 4,6-dehydratase
MSKTALVTGITGQDGSYLTEHLLEKGYEVHGVVRHASTSRFERIHHLRDRVTLHEADLLDQLSLVEAIERSAPDELYNLAAQSFVPTSWKQPLLTGDITALGVTRVLEALRHVDPSIRFYQASSSEMFGNVRETPQSEETPFYPRSPYGVAKVYGHFITVNYRESYDLYAVSGILFNHECVTADTPVITHRDGMIDIRPVEDVVPHRTDPSSGIKYSQPPADPLEVWDEDGWTGVTQMTATWNDPTKPGGKPVHRVAARGASFAATDDHVAFRTGREEVEVGELEEGDHLELVDLPEPTDSVVMTDEEAWLLGVLAADGYLSGRQARFVSSDEDLVDRVAESWSRVTGGRTSRRLGVSGFEDTTPAIQLDLVGAPSYARWIHGQLYTRRSSCKRVPRRVLNAREEARRAFLRGYNDGDGLKAGHGTYEFESFKTNSSTLAQGLWWLAGVTLGQRTILCVEERDGRLYYQINLNNPSNPSGAKTGKGVHLRRPKAEIVTTEPETEPGWLFDLATDSGTFHAGVGDGWIHNSPRRGLEFVTRKVARAAAAIDLGLQDEVRIGNLDARRDWGFAGDYVDAMWRMLQRDEPDDYVVGTGETRTVRRLCEVAFEATGVELAWEGEGVDERGLDADTGDPLVVVDEEFFRPAEVEALVADPSKAERELGWEPRVSFREMIRRMVAADRKRLEEETG